MLSSLKKRLRTGSFALLAVVLIASAATRPHISERAAAPLLSGAQVDDRVLAIIARSCGDCHSDATRYPWYSYVAPVSWLVTRDVIQGRERLNLSKWSDYPTLRRQRLLSEIANQVRDEEMPLPLYTLLHPGAKLSKPDADAIFDWTQMERARLISASAMGRS